MADQFKVGTKVRKKSGGSVMTVVKIANGQCLCEFKNKKELASRRLKLIRWFKPTAVESLWFGEGDLQVVKPEDRDS